MTEMIIIVLLIIFLIYDYKKDKNILSPCKVFNFVWLVVFGLYQLKLSYIQRDFSLRTLCIFLIAIVVYNVTYIILNARKVEIHKKKFLKFNSKKMLNIFFYIFLLCFLVETFYSGGVPLIWKLIGSSKTYFDYGISSLHGAVNGMAILLGAYYLNQKKEKKKYVFLIYGLLIISRQVLISMLLQAGIVYIFIHYKKKKMINIKKIILIGLVGVISFMIMGNFRSGKDTMDQIFEPKINGIPNSIMWIYSYTEFSFSNFDRLVSMTKGGENGGLTILKNILPTVIEKIIPWKMKFNNNYLVKSNFNVSTYLPEIYIDFGIIGIVVFHVLIAILGFYLYKKALIFLNNKYVLMYSIYLHNIFLLFFINMFLFLSIMVEFVYIYLIFDNEEEKLTE